MTEPDKEAGSSTATEILHQCRPNFQITSDKYTLIYAFRPLLYFDRQSDSLEKVQLLLVDVLSSKGDKVPSDTADRAAITDLSRTLEDKYGAPVSQSGHCQVTAEDVVYGGKFASFACQKNWRSEGQTIHYEFGYRPTDQDLNLWIDYKSAPKGL